MGFSYDIKTSQADKRSTVCLSVCHLLYAIINLFVSTFLIAHIYSLTTDLFSYALNVGIYQLSTYGTMLVSYFLLSIVVDKTNRVWVYRIGCILEAALVIVTIFYGKDLAKIVVLAGFLNGLMHGAYYASYNVLKQEMVSRKSMDKYILVINVLLKVISIVCPILLGALIEVSTFTMVAIYVLIICIVQTIISFFVKSKKPENSDFSIIEYLKKIKKKTPVTQGIKTLYLIGVPYSLINVVSALLNINIMMHFGSNFSLGIVTSAFSVVSIIVLILLNKLTKVGKRGLLLWIVALMQIAGAVIFTVVPNLPTLLIYNFTLAICDVIIITVYDLHRNKNLKEAGLYDDIAEHQCVVESIFQIGRIVTFSILILVGLVRSYILFQILFVVFMAVYASTTIFMACYEKRIIKKDKEKKAIDTDDKKC